MPRKTKVEYDSDLVWAAASAAYRMNSNKYHKTDNHEGQPVVPNRTIVYRLLDDPASISDEDRETGSKVRRYYNGISFKILAGKFVSQYERNAATIAQKEKIDSGYDIAVVTSILSSYERAVARDSGNQQIAFASGGCLGKVGDKVQCSGKVVKSIYSIKWGVFFITIVTEADQVVFFSFKKQIDIGTSITIKGTVKSHKNDPEMTQLNRVKLLS